MSTQVKSITLRAKYEGDFRGLNDDIAKLKSIGRNLQANNPFKIRPTLDLSGIRGDAQRAAKEFNTAFKAALGSGLAPGSAVSKGGIIIPASAASGIKNYASVSSGAFKQIATDGDKVIKTFEQLERGVQRVTTATKKGNKRSETVIDTRPLESFKKSLADIERAFAGRLGAAKGSKGDVASLLAEKQKAINDVLSGANLKSLPGNERKRAQVQLRSIRDTPTFHKAEQSLDRLEERIQGTRGTQGRADAKQSRGLRIDALKDSLLGIDTATAASLGKASGSKGDVAALLAQKRQLIETELAKYSDIADSPAYKQAQKALNNLDKGVAQKSGTQQNRATKDTHAAASQRATDFISDYDRQQQAKVKDSKIEESAASLIDHRIAREQEVNRILDARERLLEAQIAQYRQLEAIAGKAGNTDAAGKYRIAGNRIGNDLGQDRLDRARASHLAQRTESDQELQNKLNRVKQQHKLARDELKAQEDVARQEPNKRTKAAALQNISRRRNVLRGFAQDDLTEIHKEAESRGLHGVAAQAKSALTATHSQGIGDMKRLAAATNQSGHAFNFHSNALLKNAATFVKWYVPAQLAMKTFQAVGFGISSAVEAQRTFKILGAVFQGTAQDSALLADQTLMLAAANGRDAKEATDSVVAWARLGLTRTQALMAVETSLRAANVAEISAAEATNYLTANYKAFGQTIADIPATLDYINSLSNKNAVAPKQIFEGLARGGVIAKQAGLELESVAAIIATVSATTQRPGAEVGNTIKTSISRLGRPKVQKDLKEQFGYDIATATGDAKKMEQVLGELAALYPTLNKLEQGRLLNIVAGATQGNRFAIVLDTWNEKLVAQAVAEGDANSAMRENAQILDSVDAKLAKLSTTWTRFFHSLGEAGAFDFLGKAIDDAGLLVDILRRTGSAVSGAVSGSSEGKGENPLKSRLSILEKLFSASGEGGARISEFSHGNFSHLGTELTDDQIRENATSFKNSGIYGGFANSIYAKSLNDGSSQLAATELKTLAQKTVETRKNLNRGNTFAQFFENISKSFGAKGSNTPKTLKLFDEASANLSTIPGAGEIGKFAINDVRPLLEGGKTDEARTALAKVAYDLRQNSATQFKSYSKDLASDITTAQTRIKATTDQVNTLKTALSKTDDKNLQQNLSSSLNSTSQLLKEQKEQLDTLKEDYEKKVTDPFTDEMGERLKRFTADVTLAAEAYGKLLDGFANTGFSGLDSKLKLGSALLERDFIGGTLDATKSDNATKNAADQAQIDKLNANRIRGGVQDNSYAFDPAIDTLQRGIDARNTGASGLEKRYAELEKATEEITRKNELERQTQEVNTAYQDARASTQSGLSRYEIGRNEGEKLTHRTRGAFAELQTDVNNPALGTGSATQDARELAGIVERMTMVKQGQAAMENRMNQIVRERGQMEIDITEQTKQQTFEVAKRLSLASREDQLRAAASAAFLRNSGQKQYSASQFQYFSQETRNAISSFSPKDAEGQDDTARQNNVARQNLEGEYSGLAISLRTLRQKIEDVFPRAEAKAAGVGNAIPRSVNEEFKKATASDITNLDNKNEIRMNLNTGPISIDLDFSKHVQSIKDAIQIPFDAKLDAVLSNVNKILTKQAGPNTEAAAGVN